MQRSRGAPLLAVVALVALAPACSGGSGSSPAAVAAVDSHGQYCSLMTELDATGKPVATANVRDPDGFTATLSAAMSRYTTMLDRLEHVAPAELRPDVAKLRTDLARHDLAAAVKDHAPIAAYAARTCH